VSALLTAVEKVAVRLDATCPRTTIRRPGFDGVTFLATYRTDPQARAASLAFRGARSSLPDNPRYVAFPAPGISVEFYVNDAEPRHRLPGNPAMGPKSRSVLSGRHVRREAAA
jgi:hypothetical protein